MFRFILLPALFIFCLGATRAQTPEDSLATYKITGQAHIFMCPFLSPKFMDVLKDACKCEVNKSEDLVIHVTDGLPLDEERILRSAESLGYERKLITIERIR
ncbi:MAG: hypothetical protein RL213_520 [Bacteroidota bacterium]